MSVCEGCYEYDEEDDYDDEETEFCDICGKSTVPPDDKPGFRSTEPWDRHSLRQRRLAFHEAGHAIAAVLWAEQWTSARIDNPGPGAGEVRYAQRVTDPASGAFTSWAGSYAEARSCYDREHPLFWVFAKDAQETVGRTDLWACLRYWAVPADGGHETLEQWAAALELAMPQIEALAARLMVEKVVYTVGGAEAEEADRLALLARMEFDDGWVDPDDDWA